MRWPIPIPRAARRRRARARAARHGAADLRLPAGATSRPPMRVTASPAVYGLGAIGDPDVVPPLIASLRDRAEDVRAAAVRVLAEVKDERGLSPIAQCLDDPSALCAAPMRSTRFGRFADRRVVPHPHDDAEGARGPRSSAPALRALGLCRDPAGGAGESRRCSCTRARSCAPRRSEVARASSTRRDGAAQASAASRARRACRPATKGPAGLAAPRASSVGDPLSGRDALNSDGAGPRWSQPARSRRAHKTVMTPAHPARRPNLRRARVVPPRPIGSLRTCCPIVFRAPLVGVASPERGRRCSSRGKIESGSGKERVVECGEPKLRWYWYERAEKKSRWCPENTRSRTRACEPGRPDS
jgi:hypothetical protein